MQCRGVPVVRSQSQHEIVRLEGCMDRGTYDGGVVDEVVKARVAEDRLKILCGSADAVEVADVKLDNV